MTGVDPRAREGTVWREPRKAHRVSTTKLFWVYREHIFFIVFGERMIGLVHPDGGKVMIDCTDNRNVCISDNAVCASAATAEEYARNFICFNFCFVYGCHLFLNVYKTLVL